MKIFCSFYAFLSISLIGCCFGGGLISEELLGKLKSAQGPQDAVLEFPSILNEVLSNPFLSLFTGPLQIDFMTNLMKQATSTVQAPFIMALKQLGLADQDISPFWITNKIALKNVKLPFVQQFSNLPFISTFKLREPYKVDLYPVQNDYTNQTTISAKASSTLAEWGVDRIGAPSVWPKTTGAGITVGSIDTGVNAAHEALRSNYGGKFFDAVNGKTAPYDDHSHGTHTVGTMVGTTRGIGVAPGAKWIACKALDNEGSGSDVTLTRCAQWILQQKPKVVCNSWGSTAGGQSWFNDEINAWAKVGIIPVFSIGNSGPKCKTAGSPGDQPNLISVGSTTQSNTMSSFSSRGPTKNGKLKPEVVAPGSGILSAGKSGTASYLRMSGTSMAAPHVAGSIALMLSLKPSMTFTQVKSALENNAIRPTVTNVDLNCGKPSNGQSYPNNAFGNGLINVKKAMGI